MSAARQQLDPCGFVAVDVTDAVRIEEFLAAARFWIVAGFLLLFSSLWVVQGNRSFVYFWLPLCAFFYLLARQQTRHPDRHVLRAWVWLLITGCVVGAPLAFLAFLVSVRRDFTPELLLPMAVVLLFFWICWRTLRARDSMSDRDEPNHFLTLGLGGSSAGPIESASLIEVWLSGGYRSILLLLFVWVFSVTFMEAKVMPSCLYLAGAIGCAAALPWFLLPVRRSLKQDRAVALLDAVARNRTQRGQTGPFSSFSAFAMLYVLRSRRAAEWFAGAVLLAGAAAILYAHGAGVVMFGVADGSLGGLAVSAALVLLAIAFVWQRRAKGYAMRGAAQIPEAGGDFSLYLRSFLDDEVELLRDGLFFRVWFVDPLLNAIRLLRFEEILVPSAWRFGRVVALERPGGQHPQPGALRLAPSSPGEWQQLVASLIDKAKFILMTVGFTSGLRWEFQQLVASRDAGKLSLVLLPDSKEAMLSTWRQFSADASMPFSCPDDVLTRCLAIRFAGEGKMPVLLTAERPSTTAFRCALNVCWLPAEWLPEGGREGARVSAKPLRLAAWAAAVAAMAFLSVRLYSLQPPSEEDANRLGWIQSAAAGSSVSMFQVGYSYQHQNAPNYWRARQWLLRASAAGNADAMSELGQIYEQGDGVAPDIRKARRWYQKGVESGGFDARAHLQSLDSRQKQADLEKAAAAGDRSAMFELGRRYSDGTEAPPDPELARHWYEQAAMRGHAGAMFRLAMYYGAAQDYARTREWLEKAASSGHARAALELAVWYTQGLIVERDPLTARRWYERAAVLGSAPAMLVLGTSYQNGEGVPRDYEQARLLYESCVAAKEQACREQSDCGSSAGYFGRRGAAEDLEVPEAVRSATIAAYHLGEIYYGGLGVPPDYRRALYWFGESADQQYAPAMVKIAELYEKGYGAPRELDEAELWLSRAAEAGSEEARFNLERLQRSRSSSE